MGLDVKGLAVEAEIAGTNRRTLVDFVIRGSRRGVGEDIVVLVVLKVTPEGGRAEMKATPETSFSCVAGSDENCLLSSMLEEVRGPSCCLTETNKLSPDRRKVNDVCASQYQTDNAVESFPYQRSSTRVDDVSSNDARSMSATYVGTSCQCCLSQSQQKRDGQTPVI